VMYSARAGIVRRTVTASPLAVVVINDLHDEALRR
jgi:hypothetical protein